LVGEVRRGLAVAGDSDDPLWAPDLVAFVSSFGVDLFGDGAPAPDVRRGLGGRANAGLLAAPAAAADGRFGVGMQQLVINLAGGMSWSPGT
jgi:hypothetical protein